MRPGGGQGGGYRVVPQVDTLPGVQRASSLTATLITPEELGGGRGEGGRGGLGGGEGGCQEEVGRGRDSLRMLESLWLRCKSREHGGPSWWIQGRHYVASWLILFGGRGDGGGGGGGWIAG